MLEAIARPFAAPATISTQRIPVLTQKMPPQLSILVWGEAGEVASAIQNPSGLGFKVESCDDTLNEEVRQYETVRVFQVMPDGTNSTTNYVDVQRVKSISFNKIATVSQPGAILGETMAWLPLGDDLSASQFTTEQPTDSCNSTYNLYDTTAPSDEVLGQGSTTAPAAFSSQGPSIESPSPTGGSNESPIPG